MASKFPIPCVQCGAVYDGDGGASMECPHCGHRWGDPLKNVPEVLEKRIQNLEARVKELERVQREDETYRMEQNERT